MDLGARPSSADIRHEKWKYNVRAPYIGEGHVEALLVPGKLDKEAGACAGGPLRGWARARRGVSRRRGVGRRGAAAARAAAATAPTAARSLLRDGGGNQRVRCGWQVALECREILM